MIISISCEFISNEYTVFKAVEVTAQHNEQRHHTKVQTTLHYTQFPK